jgi:hypothetical protein
MHRKIRYVQLCAFLVIASSLPASAAMQDYPIVRLRALDKVAARTQTFDAKVGTAVQFGAISIKAQACRKADPVDKPESAAFLQIWEANFDHTEAGSQWVFSGWMFASSPALSPMDHAVYDVWVLDCLGTPPNPTEPPPAPVAAAPEAQAPEESTAPETETSVSEQSDTEAGH